MKIKLNAEFLINNKNKFAIFIFVLIISLQLFYIIHKNEYKDFKIYYTAAIAYLNSDDIYSIDVLNKYSSENITLPFIYPPISVLFFIPFQLIPLKSSFYVFLMIKILAIFVLMYVFRRFICEEKFYVFIFLLLFSFNSSFLVDLRAGNVTIIEQVFLWVAFYSFSKKKYNLFIFLILVSSIFKIVPLFFLSILIFLPRRTRFRYLNIAAVAILFIILVNFLFSYEYSIKYFTEVLTQRPNQIGSSINPNLMGFIGNVFRLLDISQFYLINPKLKLELIIYIILVFLILISSCKYLIYFNIEQNLFLFIANCILVYFLIIPRVMFYQLFIVVPSVFYIMVKSNLDRYLKYIILFLVLFPNVYFNRIVLGRNENELSSSMIFLIIDYLPLLTIFLIWLILNKYLRKKTSIKINTTK